ncbi:hypothetical protein PCASD_19662 [Puccinia coronata f. sp. avenae]|uniref:Uncharacterized protein n=1 Tax=Puccinia coronata f. sp. avenae TaxID=200324 RepID=A0A2N5TLI3_9BASI|nr:hypothetical protein PCASD_19662 [Puccinia coronata f. sp. avenae]
MLDSRYPPAGDTSLEPSAPPDTDPANTPAAEPNPGLMTKPTPLPIVGIPLRSPLPNGEGVNPHPTPPQETDSAKESSIGDHSECIHGDHPPRPQNSSSNAVTRARSALPPPSPRRLRNQSSLGLQNGGSPYVLIPPLSRLNQRTSSRNNVQDTSSPNLYPDDFETPPPSPSSREPPPPYEQVVPNPHHLAPTLHRHPTLEQAQQPPQREAHRQAHINKRHISRHHTGHQTSGRWSAPFIQEQQAWPCQYRAPCLCPGASGFAFWRPQTLAKAN